METACSFIDNRANISLCGDEPQQKYLRFGRKGSFSANEASHGSAIFLAASLTVVHCLVVQCMPRRETLSSLMELAALLPTRQLLMEEQCSSNSIAY